MPIKVYVKGVGLVNFPDNFTEEQIKTAIETDIIPKSNQSTAQQPQIENVPQRSMLSELGRQAGLTLRAGLEGTANTLGIFSDPLAAVSNKVLGTELQPLGQATTNLLNRAGVTQPETSTERNVQEAAKLLAGTGGIIKSAAIQAPRVTSQVAANTLKSIANAPGMQALGSIGAGYAGSEAREAGGSPTTQVLASLAGGLGLPITVAGIERATNSLSNTIKNYRGTSVPNEVVANTLKESGIDITSMPKDVQRTVAQDVQDAIRTGNNLSPDALRRLADYRAVGATPMSSSLSLNPAEITQQRNLAKIGANSKDPAAQQLANLQRSNDVKLISGLNTLGAESADDAVSAGNKIISALNVKDEATKNIINNYYKQARETSGRSAKLDPRAFTQQANNMLDDALLGGKLPADVRNKLNEIATGKMPFTVDTAEQYKTAIAGLQRSSSDPAERMALGKIREALDSTPLIDGQGQQAINAFNKARGANRAYMQMVDKTPALKAVRDGIEPDKFVNTFILSKGGKSNISDVKALRDAVGDNPEAVKTIRNQIVAHLKDKATSGNADEVANFSPSAYKNALKSIGDDKLDLFFTPEDVKMLKAIGRVSSYEKFQPTGSAVNNSNTGGAITGMLDKIANSSIIRRIPAGGFVADNAGSISTNIQAKNALNAAKGITVTKVKQKSNANIPLGALIGLSSVSE